MASSPVTINGNASPLTDSPLASSGPLHSLRPSPSMLRRPSNFVETDSCAIVVMGASGDLAKKKTFPALYKLFQQNLLPPRTRIFGFARTAMHIDAFHARMREYLAPKTDCSDELQARQQLNDFLSLVTYSNGSYSCDEPDGFNAMIEDIESNFEMQPLVRHRNRLYYLALPPSTYPTVCRLVRKHGMGNTSVAARVGASVEEALSLSPAGDVAAADATGGWLRVIIEKPFGHDLESSDRLMSDIGELLSEEQVYRIDHYLGKELVQNLVVMRFANRFLSPLWTRDNISNVQIIFKEPFGTEGRGGYFDQVGILRDVIQNHLLQVMALLAMEKPVSLSSDDVRDEKLKVLRAVKRVPLEDVVLGQYIGDEAKGKPSYRDDPTVPEGSNADTFAMCVLYVNNERWDGVPWILKAGKALNERKAEVRVQLRDVAGDLFGADSSVAGRQARNELVLRLQPDEAIYMKMTVKQPGLGVEICQSELELRYDYKYAGVAIPDAYERLILDALRGDQQHFVRRDELREAWAIFEPVLHAMKHGDLIPEPYVYGSRGPLSADELRESRGHHTTAATFDALRGLSCELRGLPEDAIPSDASGMSHPLTP